MGVCISNPDGPQGGKPSSSKSPNPLNGKLSGTTTQQQQEQPSTARLHDLSQTALPHATMHNGIGPSHNPTSASAPMDSHNGATLSSSSQGSPPTHYNGSRTNDNSAGNTNNRSVASPVITTTPATPAANVQVGQLATSSSGLGNPSSYRTQGSSSDVPSRAPASSGAFESTQVNGEDDCYDEGDEEEYTDEEYEEDEEEEYEEEYEEPAAAEGPMTSPMNGGAPLRPGPDTVSSMALFRPGETIGGKYIVQETLPIGFIGRTYVALSTVHNVKCAFKVICFISRLHLADSVREDQKVLTRLQHANVLSITDVMEDPRRENMILVSSYVPNRNIVRHCKTLLQSNPERYRQIAREIGVGIRVLHSHNLYHHNLKLENILETKDGGCCICDAGFFHLLSSVSVEHLASLREPVLLAPEVFTANTTAEGLQPGKLDMWGFGMSLYRLAFGVYPVDLKTVATFADIKKQMTTFKLKFPDVQPSPPSELLEVLRWTLDPNPATRPNIMKLMRHPYFRLGGDQSFVSVTVSSAANVSFAANSATHMHRSITDQHSGFAASLVLGKGTHCESFLVHLPSNPQRQFVLKQLHIGITRRYDAENKEDELSVRRQLAFCRKVRHRNIANFLEFVNGAGGSFATQKYLSRGSLGVNFPVLDGSEDGLKCTAMMCGDILKGLHCLHTNNVRHLNLKPTNVFYTEGDRFAIADFGPMMVLPEELLDTKKKQSARFSLPPHIEAELLKNISTGSQYVDTFTVGLMAVSAVPEFRIIVWEQYLRHNDEPLDVNRIVSRIKQPQQFPHLTPAFLSFVETALLQCTTAKELIQHAFLAKEIRPEIDLRPNYVDIHEQDLRNALREKFAFRDEHRLADLFGHDMLLHSPAVGTLEQHGRSVSAVSMDRASMHQTANDESFSTSLQAQDIMKDEHRICFMFRHQITCGVCRKELKIVIYRCPHCVDYIRCGKCALVDQHGADLDEASSQATTATSTTLTMGITGGAGAGAVQGARGGGGHILEPFIIESIQHSDFDDEDSKVATLVPPSAISAHALEEVEMQADLPAGALLDQAAPMHHTKSMSMRSTSRVGKAFNMSKPMGQHGPGASVSLPLSSFAYASQGNEPAVGVGGFGASISHIAGGGASMSQMIPMGSTTNQQAGFSNGGGGGAKCLLKEDEANDGITPMEVVQRCRDYNSEELMLDHFALEEIPAALWDPPLDRITVLDLSYNNLVMIPHEISFLKSLMKLSVANNQLVELPDSIGELPDLQSLNVTHNLLEDLPQSLMFADRLETIWMDYNCCTEFPGVILDMPQLNAVYLVENRKISKWPPVAQLQALGNIKFALDNEPLLYKEYFEIKESIFRVSIMWNKIYPDEIIPNLYCGSLRSAQSMAVYDRLHITYLLTTGRGLKPIVPEGMNWKSFNVDDIEGAIIENNFDEAVEFIEESLAKDTGCLVHCFAGMSRSATTVIAFLMMKRGMRLDEAYCLTRKGRPPIYPNVGFFNQLISLDTKLFPGQRELNMASMERHLIPSA